MKKILVVGITALLTGLILTRSISAVVITSKLRVNKQSFETSVFGIKNSKIFNVIGATTDKILVIDKIIGGRRVKYWEHIIDDVFVMNDSMLLHMDLMFTKLLEYDRCWTGVEVTSISFGDGEFEGDYHWKRKVVFPDKDDCGLFYTFYDEQEYPLFCWEVRYAGGNTTFYDLNETPIGYGVTAPANGFAIQGYGEPGWRCWRENAQEWYQKWYDGVNSISSPSVKQISYFISNESANTEAFYVIAHSGGQANRFLTGQNVYYYADQLHIDMENRSPMKLAVLCCCSAMNQTGPGTLSYEFRKGEMADTVTIGYVNMGSCPNWVQSLDWQDFMFQKIDQGYTVKKAFDRACTRYPAISNYVKFVGDPYLKITDGKSRVSEKRSYVTLIELLEAIMAVLQIRCLK